MLDPLISLQGGLGITTGKELPAPLPRNLCGNLKKEFVAGNLKLFKGSSPLKGTPSAPFPEKGNLWIGVLLLEGVFICLFVQPGRKR